MRTLKNKVKCAFLHNFKYNNYFEPNIIEDIVEIDDIVKL